MTHFSLFPMSLLMVCDACYIGLFCRIMYLSVDCVLWLVWYLKQFPASHSIKLWTCLHSSVRGTLS